jgi:uncharacterized protein
MVPASGEIKGVDPHCVAYKRIFDEITDRFNRELLGGIPGMEMAACQSGPMNVARAGIMSLMQKIISK